MLVLEVLSAVLHEVSVQFIDRVIIRKASHIIFLLDEPPQVL